MMNDEEEVGHTVFKNVPSQPLPLVELPLLARFRAASERKQASIELSIRHITMMQRIKHNSSLWEDHIHERAKLKELFLESDKVVKENKASISRFYEIIKEQKMHKVNLEQEIKSTRIDIEDYVSTKETMEKYVRQYSIFANFLENVAAESRTGDLLSVRDILNRYEVLEATRSDLSKILEAEMETEAQIRRQMIELTENRSSELKALANRLVMLQVARRDAIDQRIYWEMIVQRIKNMILVQEEQSMVLRGACWDLYNEICRRRKDQPTVSEDNMSAQLDYIQKSITFYKEVLTIATASMEGVGILKHGTTLRKGSKKL